jgi:phospholipid-translocating P-type ATPase (flippase)
MEMVNYCQAFFIDNDIKMYDSEADMPAMARTSNMNGDLASIQYVFSDKTGTLTRNVMEFRRCSVAGTVFGNMEVSENAPPDKSVVEGQPLSDLAKQAISQGPGSAAYSFMLVLAVCHTVVMESLGDGGTAYQAESPDEEALVSAAADLGFRFTGRGPGEVRLKVGGDDKAGGEELTFQLLCTIAFTSTRKRMSVIVKTPDGKVLLLTKGADNIVGGRAKEFHSTDSDAVDAHLRLFSEDGLRTLMLAVRELPESEFDAWFQGYQKAAASIQNRTEAIGAVADEIERDLVVVGTTAIEDKFQEGVPDTIADLLDGGIKVWVLTGDKMETAINIGYSCRLLSSRMTLLKLKDTGDPATIRRHLKKLLNALDWLVERERKLGDTLGRRIMERMTQCARRGPGDFRSSWQAGEEDVKILEDEDLKVCFRPQNEAPHFKELTSDTVALVVDGPALAHVLGDPEYEAMFLRLSSICRSVVACRVSPAQKRLVVRLVKAGVKPMPITLSIGDGANDVAMIQEAQIGVGISGKEGQQAVNSADFAIAQFRYLRRLLLIHGRYDYRRMSKVILYSFYKNMVLTFILFYYLFFTGFSGQSLFNDLVYSAFNFLCAMPIIWYGAFGGFSLPES